MVRSDHFTARRDGELPGHAGNGVGRGQAAERRASQPTPTTLANCRII